MDSNIMDIKRCSGLSSNKRTNGLQTGPEQEATSNKDWRFLESQKRSH